MGKKYRRRSILLHGVSTFVGMSAGAGLLFKQGRDDGSVQERPDFVRAVVAQRLLGPCDYEAVVAHFDSAATSDLLLSYQLFYPRLIEQDTHGNHPAAIEAAVARYGESNNPHRLEALPAIAAAHAVRFVGVSRDHWARIRDVLHDHDGHRQVKEIVLQNLITASLPGRDVHRRFESNETVLMDVAGMIADAKDRPELLVSAAMASTFLLNTALLQRSRGNAALANRAITLLEAQTNRAKRLPRHFTYLQDVIDAHRSEFKSFDAADPASLPSHVTEVLLTGVGGPTFTSRLGILYARMVYELRSQESLARQGTHAADLRQQARAAMPKLLEYSAAAGLDGLGPIIAQSATARRDGDFVSYFLDEYAPLTRAEKERSSDGYRQLKAIADNGKPLVEYRDEAFAAKAGYAEVERVAQAGLTVGAAALAGSSAFLLTELVNGLAKACENADKVEDDIGPMDP